MNENGNKYAMAALKERRAALMGEIIALRKSMAWKVGQLAHLDATIRLLEPSADPDAIKPVRPYKRIPLFKQGELSTAVRDVLRRGARPMLLAEIVADVVEAVGATEKAIPAMRHRVRASLEYLHREKMAVEKHGTGRKTRWVLAS